MVSSIRNYYISRVCNGQLSILEMLFSSDSKAIAQAPNGESDNELHSCTFLKSGHDKIRVKLPNTYHIVILISVTCWKLISDVIVFRDLQALISLYMLWTFEFRSLWVYFKLAVSYLFDERLQEPVPSCWQSCGPVNYYLSYVFGNLLSVLHRILSVIVKK